MPRSRTICSAPPAPPSADRGRVGAGEQPRPPVSGSPPMRKSIPSGGRRLWSVALRGTLGTLLLLAGSGWAPAQDFKVQTRIFDARSSSATEKKDRRATPVGRSTALFHAGKVYDSLDAGNQLTIFEPAQKRFVLLDGSRRIATYVTFDELETLLYQAEKRAEEQLLKLKGTARSSDAQLASHLKFQLQPVFQESFDDAKQQLKLSGAALNYTVRCAPADPVEVVDIYLNYADWAKKLDYLVNAQAPLPAPRLKVNDALRERKRLPVEVQLTTHQAGGLRLTAEHNFTWTLDQHDRKTIRHWEDLLHSKSVKPVSREEFFTRPALVSARDKR
ncbi:MAG: hypothetical protein ACKV0T_00950 [Planctomycetales bacterium]